MATYIVNQKSNLVAALQLNKFAGSTTFVVQEYHDIVFLKKSLSDSGIISDEIEFLLVSDFRDELLKKIKPGKRICSKNELLLMLENISSDKEYCAAGKALAAGQDTVLQAMSKFDRSGVDFKRFAAKELSSFISKLTGKLSENHFLTEQGADKILFDSAVSIVENFERRIIFYGFPPFCKEKLLMDATAKLYRNCDAIIYDLGDSEVFYLWARTLEKIFGECESLLDVLEGNTSTEFHIYESAVDEVLSAIEKIVEILSRDSSAKVGVCLPCGNDVRLTMLLDELDLRKISYCNTFGRRYKIENHRALISLWADWQMKRDINSFCRFCSELLANKFIEDEQFEEILQDTSKLQTECLSENYDVVLELGNLKGLHSFDAAEKYDFYGKNFSFKYFYEKFRTAFLDILPAKMLEALDSQQEHRFFDESFSRQNLVRYFSEFVQFESRDYSQNFTANIVLLGVEAASKQSFSDIFVLGADGSNFNVQEDSGWFRAETLQTINASVVGLSDCGERVIKDGYNYLQTALDKKILQKARFESLYKFCNLTISYSNNVFSSDLTEQDPAEIFSGLYYNSSGEFFTSKVEAKLLVNAYPAGDLSKLDNLRADEAESIMDCAASYSCRHDLSNNYNEFCFGVDNSNVVKISCKSLEYLLKNPHVGFYDVVLGLRTMPWNSRTFDKKLLIGSLAHSFLQIFEARANFYKKVSERVFFENIASRAMRTKIIVEKAYLAADSELPADFLYSLNFAAVLAKMLASRLLKFVQLESFCSEFALPKNLFVSINSAKIILSGVIDFMACRSPVESLDKFTSDITIIDFKTGSDQEITERNIEKHMQKFAGLQLFLYAIAMRELGFQRLNIMILRPDSDETNSSVSIDYILKNVPNVMANLERFVKNGLVERQVFGKVFKKYFADRVPLATTDLY